MKKKARGRVEHDHIEDNVNGASSKNSIAEIQHDHDSSVLECMSKDDEDSENCKVIKDAGSDVINNELVLKRNVDKQNENSAFNGKEKQRPKQQNKTESNITKPDCDPCTHTTSAESALVDSAGDWSTNYSNTFVKPKIIAGPGETSLDTNVWTKESMFDNMKLRISPLTTDSERLQYAQLVEKCRNLRSVPETSYLDGDSYVSNQQASCRQVTHGAFTKTRLATLRKTPANIVRSKFSPGDEIEKESFSSKGSMLNVSVSAVRMDDVQMGSPRFDPYHSDCGPDCRKCFFLTQTQDLPHLTPKVIKVDKTIDTTVSSKSQRKTFGFGFPSTKSKETQRPA